MLPLLLLLLACQDRALRPCGDYCRPVTVGAMAVACTCPSEDVARAAAQAKAAALQDFGANVAWVECDPATRPLRCRIGLKEAVPLTMFCNETACEAQR